MNIKIKTGCVIVLYNPNIDLLKKVIDAILNQVDCLFIADNSLTVNHIFINGLNKNIIYQKMINNIGIARSQNIGINYFTKNNYTHIIFLDQDSIIAKGLVKQLTNDLKYLQNLSISVGGVSARAMNRQNGKMYQETKKRGKIFSEDLTEVNELMSSTSLIPIEMFSKVGLLEETLFIDGVDHEWCWRAKKIENLRFFVSEKAVISHQLGEGDKFFIIKNVAISTPFRTYYQYRNFFLLSRRNYVPLSWKFLNGFKYFVKLFYYPIFIQPRKEYINNIIKGVIDGIKYKDEKIDE